MGRPDFRGAARAPLSVRLANGAGQAARQSKSRTRPAATRAWCIPNEACACRSSPRPWIRTRASDARRRQGSNVLRTRASDDRRALACPLRRSAASSLLRQRTRCGHQRTQHLRQTCVACVKYSRPTDGGLPALTILREHAAHPDTCAASRRRTIWRTRIGERAVRWRNLLSASPPRLPMPQSPACVRFAPVRAQLMPLQLVVLSAASCQAVRGVHAS